MRELPVTGETGRATVRGMAYILGCVIPVALAVFFVWNLGIVAGTVAWLISLAAILWAARALRRRVDPIGGIDDE